MWGCKWKIHVSYMRGWLTWYWMIRCSSTPFSLSSSSLSCFSLANLLRSIWRRIFSSFAWAFICWTSIGSKEIGHRRGQTIKNNRGNYKQSGFFRRFFLQIEAKSHIAGILNYRKTRELPGVALVNISTRRIFMGKGNTLNNIDILKYVALQKNNFCSKNCQMAQSFELFFQAVYWEGPKSHLLFPSVLLLRGIGSRWNPVTCNRNASFCQGVICPDWSSGLDAKSWQPQTKDCHIS